MQTRVPTWFDREFVFPFSAAMFPNILARLRGTPARLEEIFRGRDSSIIVKKQDGKWSAQENAGNLFELETLWCARIEDYKLLNPSLTAADLQNRKTDDGKYNARSLDEILNGFRSARLQLLRCVEDVDEAVLERSTLHPRLHLPMRLVDHLYFVAEHDDHHLARIWELLNL